MDAQIRVTVIDQDRGYAAALQAILETGGEFRCAATFSNLGQGLKQLAASNPHVVVLGLRRSHRRLAKIVSSLRAKSPDSRIVVVVDLDSDALINAVAAGADACLLRTEPWAVVSQAIATVHMGGSVFTPAVRCALAWAIRKGQGAPASDGLSSREHQILDLLRAHSRNKEIAAALNVSVPTVRTHLRTIYVKLRVQTRAEAIRRAQEHAEGPKETGNPPSFRKFDKTRAPVRSEKTPRPGEASGQMELPGTSLPE